MKYILRSFILTLTFIVFFSSGALALNRTGIPIELTKEEQQWLYKNKDRVFILGIDPYTGTEYFKYKGEEKGYVIPMVDIMNKDLGLNIKIQASKNWGEIYSGLQNGSIDILLGANETPERKKMMAFTNPICRKSYAIIAKKYSNIHAVGDIDRKNVGFLKKDVVIDLLPNIYKNIRYKEKLYNFEEEGIVALKNNEIDALIIPGGAVVYDYIYRFPQLEYAFKLYTINSDMTLSTRKSDEILAGILNKEISYLKKDKLPKIFNQNEIEYNLKIMNLTTKEIQWLKNDGKAIIGITKDYLPFDYYENGIYKGISGEIIKEISRKTGIKFINVCGDFGVLEQKLRKGEIDVLNIAKTDERMKYVIYPRPYSTERDIIIGRKNSEDVRDIFGLEGKRVAVIKGFWDYELLMKNLTKVNIVDANNIQDALMLVHKGKADYLIENPTVVRYYIEEFQLYDLVEKGVTSTNSYMYYGVTKGKPELASIIDKVLPLMDIYELRRIGYEGVPHTSNMQYYQKLIFAIMGLVILLVLIVLYVIKLINDLVKERTDVELLRQREHFLYMDALTCVHNRNYFSAKIENTLNTRKYPQTIIVTDMNNLKSVNDKYGHHVGDELLKLFAYVLKENCPKDSLIFRMGGDEFHIILENTNEQRTEEIIANIKDVSLQKSSIVVGNQILYPTAAFGYATRYFENENFEELIKAADKRMYIDKNKHKTLNPA